MPQRNLLRSFELGLPDGQTVARAMGVTPLDDAQIWIGKAVDSPQGGPDPDVRGSIDQIKGLEPFKGNCPLWTYILAEAFHCKEDMPIPVTENKTISTPKLGPVGGRIVAEVFLGLMFGDNNSLLNLDPGWMPPRPRHAPHKEPRDYRLKDLVAFALGQ